MRERLFLDTVYVQALLNQQDQYHLIAKSLLSLVRNAQEVWITEAILLEVGNALSAKIVVLLVNLSKSVTKPQICEWLLWIPL